jgi:hypothetical protein
MNSPPMADSRTGFLEWSIAEFRRVSGWTGKVRIILHAEDFGKVAVEVAERGLRVHFDETCPRGDVLILPQDN